MFAVITVLLMFTTGLLFCLAMFTSLDYEHVDQHLFLYFASLVITFLPIYLSVTFFYYLYDFCPMKNRGALLSTSVVFALVAGGRAGSLVNGYFDSSPGFTHRSKVHKVERVPWGSLLSKGDRSYDIVIDSWEKPGEITAIRMSGKPLRFNTIASQPTELRMVVREGYLGFRWFDNIKFVNIYNEESVEKVSETAGLAR